MVEDIDIRIALAEKKAAKRREQAEHIKNEMLKWPEFSKFHDIYVYVGKGVECGYLLILMNSKQLQEFMNSSAHSKFEKKYLMLTASLSSIDIDDIEATFEYDSKENLDNNFGGSISRRLAT